MRGTLLRFAASICTVASAYGLAWMCHYADQSAWHYSMDVWMLAIFMCAAFTTAIMGDLP